MNSFPLRASPARPFRLSSAAELLDRPVEGDGDPELLRIVALSDAGERDLSLAANRRYLPALERSRAGALLLSREIAGLLPAGERRPRIVVADAHQALARLLEWLHPERPSLPGIHPTAVLGAGVELGEDVRIGPYAVVEAGVELGEGVRVGAHAVVGAGSRVGSGSLLHPQVVIYPGTVIGRGVILHAGVRLGVDGFGYVFVNGEHRKVPHVGRCTVADGVEVGANTTIDRGSIGDTAVGEGTKIDNLVQIGHNASIGARTILVSQVGISGSTVIDEGVVVGGQAGLGGHIRIGRGARLAAQAGITGDVPPGATYMGFPGRPRQEFLRSVAAQRKVPELMRRLRELEQEVRALRQEREAEGSERVE